MVDLRIEWEAGQGFSTGRGTAGRRVEAAGSARRSRRRFTRTQPALNDILTGFVEPAVEVTNEEAQLITLEELQSPASLWPVDTGYSLVHFGWRNVPARGGMREWRLSNDADYAGYVEERTGAIARTLDALQSTILRGIDLALTRRLSGG